MPQSIVPVVGDPMPDIALVDAGGRSSTLEDVRDGRRAIVHFMRTSTCPVCLAHAATVQRLFDAGEIADAAFVLVPPGGPDEAATTAGRMAARGIRAEVWASGTDHGSVGLGQFLGLQHSGTFVIDEGGLLLAVRTSTLPTGSFSRDEVVAALPAPQHAADEVAPSETEPREVRS